MGRFFFIENLMAIGSHSNNRVLVQARLAQNSLIKASINRACHKMPPLNPRLKLIQPRPPITNKEQKNTKSKVYEEMENFGV